MSSKKIKVKVLRTFRNKYSKSLHEAGTYLFISRSRYEEINNAGQRQASRAGRKEGIDGALCCRQSKTT